MTYQVKLTLQAERDLDHILEWLTQRSPQGAASWLRRWDEVRQFLSERADKCLLAPENEDHEEEIRHTVFKTRRGKKYRTLFVIREGCVYITNLRGPGQDLVPPEEFGG